MYRSISKVSQEFTKRFGCVPTRVLLSNKQCQLLFDEMYGWQKEVIIKENRVLGLVVSNSMVVDTDFMLVSKHHFMVVHLN